MEDKRRKPVQNPELPIASDQRLSIVNLEVQSVIYLKI
jgi:hypothetical protein